MGSRSDLPVMQACSNTLAELGIAHEVRILSAHRDPEGVRAYALGAPARGVQVLIAGAPNA
jgi:5-(carboxyamino)imidazole ribonucleotide mutase